MFTPGSTPLTLHALSLSPPPHAAETVTFAFPEIAQFFSLLLHICVWMCIPRLYLLLGQIRKALESPVGIVLSFTGCESGACPQINFVIA